jgi:hypothetical protein
MAAVVGSVYLNLEDTTDDVSKRTVLIFFAVLINAFMSAAEVSIALTDGPGGPQLILLIGSDRMGSTAYR